MFLRSEFKGVTSDTQQGMNGDSETARWLQILAGALQRLIESGISINYNLVIKAIETGTINPELLTTEDGNLKPVLYFILVLMKQLASTHTAIKAEGLEISDSTEFTQSFKLAMQMAAAVNQAGLE